MDLTRNSSGNFRQEVVNMEEIVCGNSTGFGIRADLIFHSTSFRPCDSGRAIYLLWVFFLHVIFTTRQNGIIIPTFITILFSFA